MFGLYVMPGRESVTAPLSLVLMSWGESVRLMRELGWLDLDIFISGSRRDMIRLAGERSVSGSGKVGEK